MSWPAPLRFLAAVVGCWLGFRLFVLWPVAPAEAVDGPSAAAQPPPTAAPPPMAVGTDQPLVHFGQAAGRMAAGGERFLAAGGPVPRMLHAPFFTPAARERPVFAAPVAAPMTDLGTAPPMERTPVPYPPLSAAPLRLANPRAVAGATTWSGSAWLFLRDDGAAALAPGGTLGRSQAGARLAYRVAGRPERPLAISARLYMPVERPQGAEVAVGVDWKPIARLPLHILAERRQRIGKEGRSDFALTVYGGGERRLLGGRLRVEAYGQAGLVGIEEGDLFADGAVRAGTLVGPVEIGAGAWGGAQPGAARLDVGPQASFRVPIGGTAIRVSAEWRFRVAGDAAPGSGPALTIATDF